MFVIFYHASNKMTSFIFVLKKIALFKSFLFLGIFCKICLLLHVQSALVAMLFVLCWAKLKYLPTFLLKFPFWDSRNILSTIIISNRSGYLVDKNACLQEAKHSVECKINEQIYQPITNMYVVAVSAYPLKPICNITIIDSAWH